MKIVLCIGIGIGLGMGTEKKEKYLCSGSLMVHSKVELLIKVI